MNPNLNFILTNPEMLPIIAALAVATLESQPCNRQICARGINMESGISREVHWQRVVMQGAKPSCCEKKRSFARTSQRFTPQE